MCIKQHNKLWLIKGRSGRNTLSSKREKGTDCLNQLKMRWPFVVVFMVRQDKTSTLTDAALERVQKYKKLPEQKNIRGAPGVKSFATFPTL